MSAQKALKYYKTAAKFSRLFLKAGISDDGDGGGVRKTDEPQRCNVPHGNAHLLFQAQVLHALCRAHAVLRV